MTLTVSFHGGPCDGELRDLTDEALPDTLRLVTRWLGHARAQTYVHDCGPICAEVHEYHWMGQEKTD